MSLKCGIVGLPNVGKSTLFNALGCGNAPASNYPFCTIEPNTAVVGLPDPVLDKLGAIFKPQRITSATTQIVDIAGIVKGASQGEGLGNQFLSHIREVDAIVHLVRCFVDDNTVHVMGSVDPARDIEVVNTELLLADLQSAERRLEKAHKAARVGDKQAVKDAAVLSSIQKLLGEGKTARTWTSELSKEAVATGLFLLTDKPVLYVANTRGSADEKHLVESFRKHVGHLKAPSLILDCQLEAEIASFSPEQRKDLLDAAGLQEPGLNRFIQSVFELLRLITFYTVVGPEVRAWTTVKGTRAAQAAGLIHSDFEKGFIRAECYKSQELLKLGSEAKIKEAGLYRSEGRDYEVEQGDILFFRFHV